MTSTTTPENIRIQALSFDPSHQMDTKAAAKLLSFSVTYLKDLRSKGTGPTFTRFGRAIRYRNMDLQVWIAAHRIETMRCAAAANKSASRAHG
ncbi:MAG: helix-turn-helix domain-containing protein [Candidatus Contendobacter sp.]|nr:helix-turn-helix domain-containing protein [Candidatus Contendobacter sp.]